VVKRGCELMKEKRGRRRSRRIAYGDAVKIVKSGMKLVK